MSETTISGTTTLHLTRRFGATRQAVFEAWTDPEQFTQWFGGRGASNKAEMDVRVGGSYRVTTERKGVTADLVGTYLEVEPPERLVFTFRWDNPLVDMVDIGDTRVTVEFRDLGEETELVLVHERLRDDYDVQRLHAWGWSGSMDALAERFPSQTPSEIWIRP